MNTSPKGGIRFSQVFLAVLLVVVMILVAFLLSLGKGANPTSPPDSSISVNRPNPNLPPGIIKAPTPYLLLPTGVQEYNVQSNPLPGDVLGTHIVADPLVSPVGSDQTFSISLEHKSIIESVTLELTTDNKVKNYPMSLTSGTNQKGTWSVTWKTDDSAQVNYYARFIVVDEKKHQTVIKFPIR